MVLGLVADMIGNSRRIIEEVLYELNPDGARRQRLSLCSSPIDLGRMEMPCLRNLRFIERIQGNAVSSAIYLRET